MKKALVLGGGGTKGSYQAGCIKALNELNIHFDIVVGTSIGALHALIYACNESHILDELWHSITIDDVIKGPINLPDSIDDIFSDIGEITTFFKKFITNKGVNIEPLKNLLNRLYDPNKLEDSNIEFGFTTVLYPQLKPLYITSDQMTPYNSLSYALASASCFPIFPIHYINKQGFIDGGYYDNLPIELALNMEATEITAIALSKKSLHFQYLNRPNIKYIIPNIKLGDMLDFNKNLIDFQYTLGYNDTCKAYGKYVGFYYTFTIIDIDEFDYYNAIVSFENNYCKYKDTKKLPLTSYLIEHSNVYDLKMVDYSIIALECIFRFEQKIQDKVYNYVEEKKLYYNNFIHQYTQLLYSNHFNMNTQSDSIFYYYHLLKSNQLSKIFKNCSKDQQAIIIALYYFNI